MDWFDREAQALCDALDNGEITEKEFNSEMRDMRSELQQQAEDAGEEAYNDRMGY